MVSFEVGEQRARLLFTLMSLRRAGVGPACVARSVGTTHKTVVDRLVVPSSNNPLAMESCLSRSIAMSTRIW